MKGAPPRCPAERVRNSCAKRRMSAMSHKPKNFILLIEIRTRTPQSVLAAGSPRGATMWLIEKGRFQALPPPSLRASSWRGTIQGRLPASLIRGGARARGHVPGGVHLGRGGLYYGASTRRRSRTSTICFWGGDRRRTWSFRKRTGISCDRKPAPRSAAAASDPGMRKRRIHSKHGDFVLFPPSAANYFRRSLDQTSRAERTIHGWDRGDCRRALEIRQRLFVDYMNIHGD